MAGTAAALTAEGQVEAGTAPGAAEADSEVEDLAWAEDSAARREGAEERLAQGAVVGHRAQQWR